MRQLELFPEKTTFEVGDRVQFFKKGNSVPMPIGSIGTVVDSRTGSRFIVHFFIVDFGGIDVWACIPETLRFYPRS